MIETKSALDNKKEFYVKEKINLDRTNVTIDSALGFIITAKMKVQ